MRKWDWTHDARDELLLIVRRADLRSMCPRGAPRPDAENSGPGPMLMFSALAGASSFKSVNAYWKHYTEHITSCGIGDASARGRFARPADG